MNVSAPETGSYEGFDGWWLRNASAEAFVIARPYPRLTAFRLNGGDSPLHVSERYEHFGVRTWFLEPVETDRSGLPASKPAKGEATGAGRLRLTGEEEDVTGLQLTMDFALDARAPRLTVTHALRNLRDTPRRLAAWAINAVEAEKGIGLTRWRQEDRRSLILFHDTAPREAAVRAEPAVLAVDYRVLPATAFCKVGTDTTCGWGAFVWDGMALKSSVAHVAGAEYPEGGGTVTFFNSGPMADSRFGEVENIGPLTDLSPGGAVELVQTLSLIEGISGDDLAAWAATIAAAP